MTIAESALGRRQHLAKGGMAYVYDLPECSVPEIPGVPIVFKKFKKKIRPVPIFGLKMLADLRDGWDPRRRAVIDASFNWMLRVVTDDDPGAAGLLFPRLHHSYFTRLIDSYGNEHHLPTEGQFLTASREYFTQKRMVFPNLEQRFQICYSMAKALGLLHRAEVVYGDLSFRNFLYRLAPRVSVMFVDTDAMRPKGATSALGLQPHTQDWEPPEALLSKKRCDPIGYAVQNYETDRYKLGLAILRILAIDVPRAAEKHDPRFVKRYLPTHLYRLLESSLQAPPSDRPSAKTWYEEMRR